MVDKRLLHDSVSIKRPAGKNEWGKESYSDPLLLSPVRFDRNFNAPGAVTNPAGSKNPTFSKPSVVFVYPKFCPVVIDESYRNGIIIDGNLEYKINKIIPVTHPMTNKVFCYEIEVM